MRIMTLKDVSHWLQIKPSTLYVWAKEGTIPHLKLGRLIRFDGDELTTWLNSHRRDSQPAPVLQRRRRRSRADHVDVLIARAKRDLYTPVRGKPDQDRATGKGGKGWLCIGEI